MTTEAALELLRERRSGRRARICWAMTASPDEVEPARSCRTRHGAARQRQTGRGADGAANGCRSRRHRTTDLAEPGACRTTGRRSGRALQLMEALERRLPEWDEPPLRLAEALRAAGRSRGSRTGLWPCPGDSTRGARRRLLGLAGLLIMRGEGEAARDLLLRCCGIAPGRADAWDTLGVALTLTNDKPLAESAFAEAQRLSPQTLEYALHRVEAACAAGSEEALLAWLEVAGEDDPLNPVLPAARGVLLERLGRRAEAIDALEAATALAPDAKLPASLLGEALARSNRLQRGRGRVAPRQRTRSRQSSAAQHARQQCCSACIATPRPAPNCSHRSSAMASTRIELCNLANATSCLGIAGRGGGTGPPRHRACSRTQSMPRRVLCNTLPYRDGITGAELLAALKDCSDRLPREACPRSPIRATPTARSWSACCQVRSSRIRWAG